MKMRQLFGRIMGFVMIIVTLALAPTIQTSNATLAATNLTSCTGMTAVAAFGAPLIILGLLVGGGLFAVSGVRGRMSGASMADMISVIGSVILVIVSLTLMVNVVTYVNALIVAAGGVGAGFGPVVYGIIPLFIYVSVIAAAGFTQARAYRRARRRSRSSRYA